MNKNEFIESCEKIKSGEMQLDFFVENNCETYINIFFKDLTCTRVLDNLDTYDDFDIVSDENEIFSNEYNIRLIHNVEVCKKMYIIYTYFNMVEIEYTDNDYDLLEEIGLFDAVNRYTKGDFNKFCDYCDKCVNVNLRVFTRGIKALFDFLPTDKGLEDFKKAVEDIDESKLQKMADVVKYGNTRLERSVIK